MLKVRTGFISNSSTSNFLTVGFRDKEIYVEILESLDIYIDPESYGCWDEVNHLKSWGYGSVQLKDSEIIAFNGYYPEWTTIGLDNIEERLNNGETVPNEYIPCACRQILYNYVNGFFLIFFR